MLAVETPADVAVVDDLGDRCGGVEVETEALLHYGAGDQFPDAFRFETGVGQVEHGRGKADQRVDGRRRAVGNAETEIGQVIAVGGERRFEQRGKGRQVRGHDGDVPRLQRRVCLECVEDGVTGDLNLATGTVGDVDLDGAVSVGRGGRAVGLDVGLELGEQTDALTGDAANSVDRVRLAHLSQRERKSHGPEGSPGRG